MVACMRNEKAVPLATEKYDLPLELSEKSEGPGGQLTRLFTV